MADATAAKWRDRFIEAGKAGLAGGIPGPYRAQAVAERRLRAENEQLKLDHARKLAQQSATLSNMRSMDLGYVEYRSAPDIFGQDRWIVGQIRSAEVRDGVNWYHVEPLHPLPTERLPRWVTDQHVREWERPPSTWRSTWQPLFAL